MQATETTPASYSWKTYEEVYRATQYLAHAITKKHLFSEVSDTNPTYREEEEKGERVEGPPRDLRVLGITSVNCEEWVTTDLAANLLGITTVPLYETLGATMMQLILEQTQMSTIFGSEKCLLNIINLATQEDSIANS